MRKYRNLLLALFIASAFLGCDKIPFLQSKKPKKAALPPIGKNVVAVIGGFYVTSEDLGKEVENYNSLLASQGITQGKIDTKDKRIAYLRNDLVKKYILYQEALDRGLDKKEDVAKALENTKINLLVSELLRQEMEKIDVTNQEITDFYNQNKDLLREPEQRTVSEIVTNTEDEAKQVYIEILKGTTDFPSLAKQFSKGKTASSGGQVGVLTPEPDAKKRIRFDKFYEVAFSPSLEVGGISNIFKGPDGFYIIRLDNLKKSEAKSLSELKDNIKSYLLFDKQQKAIKDMADKLTGETKVEIYEEKVD